jgi:phosphohistidine phosphatase
MTQRALFLMRHGDAIPAGFDGDAARRLSNRGEAEAERMVKALLEMGHRPTAIWHSPYLRAQQTARLAQSALGDVELTERPGITPFGDPPAVARTLKSEAPHGLLLVSHLPFLPELIKALCPRAAFAAFPTASVAHLLLPGEPESAEAHADDAQWVDLWSPKDLAP